MPRNVQGALTIAIRYSAQRQQFGPPDAAEISVRWARCGLAGSGCGRAGCRLQHCRAGWCCGTAAACFHAAPWRELWQSPCSWLAESVPELCRAPCQARSATAPHSLAPLVLISTIYTALYILFIYSVLPPAPGAGLSLPAAEAHAGAGHLLRPALCQGAAGAEVSGKCFRAGVALLAGGR